MNKKIGRFLIGLVVLATLGILINGNLLSGDKGHTRPRPRAILVNKEQLEEKTLDKIIKRKSLSREEKKAIRKLELKTYRDLRAQGVDEVSFTRQSQILRDYRLRKQKRRGIFFKKDASLSEILFPGVVPENYQSGEMVFIYTDLVESRVSPIPFHVHNLPWYSEPRKHSWRSRRRQRRNLGSRLLGHNLQPGPFFDIYFEKDVPCTVFAKSYIGSSELEWLRHLVKRQYRVHLQLDSLPVLVTDHLLNSALRGYPVGFQLSDDKIYLYNHLKFTIFYNRHFSHHQDLHITGFQVHPVSVMHDPEGESCAGFNVENQPDQNTFVSLQQEHHKTPVLFSYDVMWVSNDDVEWSDRWDLYLLGSPYAVKWVSNDDIAWSDREELYLLGSPDRDIRYFWIVNSLIIIVINTAIIALIVIRALSKAVAGSGENTDLKGGDDETGWKSLRGDVFRPPTFSPMTLSVLVGSGAQIGVTVFLAVFLSVVGITNAMKQGQMLTSLIVLYALSGPVAGYSSARLYKFCGGENWKKNALLPATALPGTFFALFVLLNVLLSQVGAATAVSFSTILVLFVLWVGVSVPLVFVGAYFGQKMPTIEAGSCTNQVARDIPKPKCAGLPFVSVMLGGLLPFWVSMIEIGFLMAAMWPLHQIYYNTGYLLTGVLIMLTACAQVSIIICYMQLQAEDHRWWWKSFWNSASAGVYLFLYSLWFMTARLRLPDALSVTIYLTYMAMFSICFGICCGSVGFISSFWFTRTIYGSTKIEFKVSNLRAAVFSLRCLRRGADNRSPDAADEYVLLSGSNVDDGEDEGLGGEIGDSSPATNDYHLLSDSDAEDPELEDAPVIVSI